MKKLVWAIALLVLGCSEIVEPASEYDGEFEEVIEQALTVQTSDYLETAQSPGGPVAAMPGSVCTRDANGDGSQDPGSATSCQTLAGGCRFQICQCLGGSLTNCTWSDWFGFGRGFTCQNNSNGNSVCSRTNPTSLSFDDAVIENTPGDLVIGQTSATHQK